MASIGSTDSILGCFDYIPQKVFLTQTETHSFRPKKSKNLISPFAAASSFPKRCLRNSGILYGIKHSKWFKDSGFERRASNDDGPTSFQSSSSDTDTLSTSSSTAGDSYIALFVRMLGLDNDPLDREQAVIALWKYSLGGKSCVDNIMQFRGAVNLTVNLLQSNSDSACEAAAGVLRMISSVNMYREIVAESGSVEELTALLRRPSLSSNVKEQGICTLCNLSVDEKLRMKIANSELLPLLLKFLEDEDIKVKEAAGGVLANLALSHQIHKIMVEAGVIPKLAELLKSDVKGSKMIKKEARSALLEIAKDGYHKILIMEEGFLLVPLVGAAAYKSFKPALYSWPSLPDGTKLEQNSTGSSKYGAAELLLGLNVGENDVNLEEAKMHAIIGRTQQQFLACIGAIELEDGSQSNCNSSSSQRFTILPWIDGVARLVLILGLEDESSIARAADSIADSSINEHMRIAFKEAGAVKQLIRLLHHPDSKVLLAAIRAMERLSVSDYVCQSLEAEGVLYQLRKIMMESETSSILTEMILSIMTQILDPGKEMKSKFYNGPVNGSTSRQNTTSGHLDKMATSDSSYSLQAMNFGDLLDSTFLDRLVMILKSSPPNLQRKAASILEFFAANEVHAGNFVSVNISSALDVVFQHESLDEIESDIDEQSPELLALEIEEVGNAISAASCLFARLLDFQQFRESIDTHHFTKLLRKLLKSNISLHNKDWVAACVVKLSSFSGPDQDQDQDLDNPIIQEVTLYETIPRLIEQIDMSFSPEVQEAAVIELNRIVSEGFADSTRAVASEGGIFPLVKLIENGTDRAIEAGLAILYNLSMDSENHVAIISAGAIPVLRRIVLSKKSQWMRALHMLRALPT